MIYCRIAPSLGGGFEGTPQEVWGVEEYEGDRDEPTVFMGLYGLPDFYALWRHRGKKWILWAGSDITHFKNGYWLEEGGAIRISPHSLANWINKHCESWVENEVEREALAEIGIISQVCPSFLGDVNQYEVSYQPLTRPKVYTSVSGNDFKLYGWDKILKLAEENPDIEFHLYGNTIWPFPSRLNENPFNSVGIYKGNIIVHGRVSKEQMNEEIKYMQGALRLTKFDGASEIIVKAMLMGQYAFSYIEYPFVDKVDDLNLLLSRKDANIEGRNWWKKNLNKFPWNINIQEKQGKG